MSKPYTTTSSSGDSIPDWDSRIAALLLRHINVIKGQSFAPSQLPDVPFAHWLALEDAGLLKRLPCPDTLQLRDQRFVRVHKFADKFIGYDCSESCPAPILLQETDLIHYQLQINKLLDWIAAKNNFRRSPSRSRFDFHLIGRKSLGSMAAASVYFSAPNSTPASISERLRRLSKEPGVIVVVFPVWPDLDLDEFSSEKLFIADLEPDLTINWPTEAEIAFSEDADLVCRMTFKQGQWTICYLGETIRLNPLAGLKYIARAISKFPDSLPLSQWDHDITDKVEEKYRDASLSYRPETNHQFKVLEKSDIQEIRKSRNFIQTQIAEAKEIGDQETLELLEDKLTQIDQYLNAHSYKGRAKRDGATEKLRKAYSKNLNLALGKIKEANPVIGKYFKNQVVYSNYSLQFTPESDERWFVDY